MEDLSNYRFKTFQIELKKFSLLKVNGSDAINFLHGQTTNSLKDLEKNQSRLTARLNHVGRVQSYFFVLKSNQEIFIASHTELISKIKEDLEKFIIMDDVELIQSDKKLFFINDPKNQFDKISTKYLGLTGKFSFEEVNDVEMVDEPIINFFKVMNGYPTFELPLINDVLVNDTRLNELAVSYKKGCFLGQETVAKIENNRGAAYYPFMIITNDKIENLEANTTINSFGTKVGMIEVITSFNNQTIIHAKLNRECRVEDKTLCFEINQKEFQGTTKGYPYFQSEKRVDLAHDLFDQAVKLFNQNKADDSLKLIDQSLEIFELPDAVEIKGVILGRLEKFEAAIECMNRLTELDPKSVMAHTNKSLFLMRLGKITEAEEEKSLATVKSFEKNGEEAKIKKQLAEEKKQKEEEILRREKMFMQVLEIDPEDAIANFGMADIMFQRKKLIDALNYVTQALKTDANYSTGYLLLGKIHEALLDNDSAKEVYQKGIVIASKRGEMMPANEMQSRLNLL